MGCVNPNSRSEKMLSSFIPEENQPPCIEYSHTKKKTISQLKNYQRNSEHQQGYQDQRRIIKRQEKQLDKVSDQDLQKPRHRYIGALTFMDENKHTYVGTGFLISKNAVLTNAHNVYNKKYDKQFSAFKFYLADENNAYQCYQIKEWRYLKQYKTCKSDLSRNEYDYALLRLKFNKDKPVHYKQYPVLSVIPQLCLTIFRENVDISIYGYPCYNQNYQIVPVNSVQTIVLHQYGMSGKNMINKVFAPHCAVLYHLNTLPGHSGSPIFMNQMIIGLHCGGSKQFNANVGLLITQNMIKILQKWITSMFCDKLNFRKEMYQHMIPFEQYLFSRRISGHFFINDKIEDMALIYQKIEYPSKKQSIKPNYQKLTYYIFQQFNQRLLDLNLSRHQLMQINVSRNISLKKLNLYHNSLKHIDLSKNQLLEQLDLAVNILQSIDLSKNIYLVRAYLWNNKLQNIDISKNILVTQIYFHGNQLTSLNLFQNIKLKIALLSKNKLQQLDITQNIEMRQLRADQNQITSIKINVQPRLQRLSLCKNKLQHIDVSQCSQLSILEIFSNSLKQINLINNTNLEKLILSDNKLIEINLKNNKRLQEIKLDNNQLDHLELSENKKLLKINTKNNKLATIIYYFDYFYLKRSQQRQKESGYKFRKNLIFGPQKCKCEISLIHDGQYQQEFKSLRIGEDTTFVTKII